MPNRTVRDLRSADVTRITPYWQNLGLERTQQRSGRLDFDFAFFSASKFLQRLVVGGAGESVLGDDCSDIFCRRHVECRILNRYAVRHHLFPADVRDFSWISLLDRNLAAVRAGEVDGGDRSGHVKRNPMLFSQY